MIHLDDLMLHDEESHFHHFNCLEGKTSYIPELKQFEDHQHLNSQKDQFFDNPEHFPHSSTFSHISQVEENHLEQPKQKKNEAKRSKGTGKKINKSRNETKNIPKNFGKGIITFIQQNKSKLSPFLAKKGFQYQQLVGQLRELKRQINTIAQLRQLWTGEKGQCLRIISNLFFRKYALEYIFNSRISSFNSHIKYRGSLWQALKQPQSFNHIKEY